MPSRRHRRALARQGFAVALAVALTSVGAGAAGPYDGIWRGASIGSLGAGCTVTTSATLTVEDGRVSGEDVIPAGSFMPAGGFAIRGTVAPDGTFTGVVGDWDARGKFSPDAFSGDYEFGPCTMLMHLNRPK